MRGGIYLLGNLERKEILGDSFVDGNERDGDLNETTEGLGQKASLRPAIPAMAVVDEGEVKIE